MREISLLAHLCAHEVIQDARSIALPFEMLAFFWKDTDLVWEVSFIDIS